MPLSGIHRLLRLGGVLVNGRPAAAKDRVPEGSTITIPNLHSSPPIPPSPFFPLPSPFSPPLNILREEPDLLFLNNPAGLAVHGPGSLDEQVRAYLRDKTGPSLSFRPGPLHRLDKPTSGVIVFSKTLAGARSFSALLREGRIVKQYLAIVEGPVTEAAVWEDALIRDREARKTLPAGTGRAGEPKAGGPAGSGGEAGTGEAAKNARTRIRPLALGGRPGGGGTIFSLILAEIGTGRTHQIRAQAAARGFPLAGDKKYGGGPWPGSFLLHAWKLELPGCAADGEEGRTIRAPLPAAFRQQIEELFPACQLPSP
jgi:23S rRNA pseudouridine955/2504/2580 synthase